MNDEVFYRGTFQVSQAHARRSIVRCGCASESVLYYRSRLSSLPVYDYAPMPESIVLVSLDYSSVTVNDHTEWTFVEVSDDQGLSAVVETTYGGDDDAEDLSPLMEAVRGRPIDDESTLERIAGVAAEQARGDMALATAVSALRTALVDIRAQRDCVSLTGALGGRPVTAVDLYANTNRRLLGSDRQPRAFAATAERAVRDGFRTIKCAPFDEVDPDAQDADLASLARPGLERVAAIRSAIGRDVDLLVDCHSRFDRQSAPAIAEELARLDVGWFEEPVEPTRDAPALAGIASRVSMPVAGGESGYGADFFEGLVEMGAVTIVMPDIKYCGGVQEAVKAANLVARRGGRTSLHGPTGPVSVLAGAHVTAAMPSAMPLEFGAYEAPWRAELIEPAERIEGGRLWLPGGSGLGARLNPKVLERYGLRWKGV